MYAAGQPRGAPVEMAFDKNGNVLFLGRSAEYGTAFLVHIERDTYKEIVLTRFPNLHPAAMAVGPDGSIYIAGNQGDTPVVLRLFEGDRTTFAFDLGMAWPQAIAVAGESVYVSGSRMKGYPWVEGFIVRLNRALTAVEKSMSLGGEATDSVNWLGLDDQGHVLAAGVTNSYHLPATGAFGVPCGPDRGLGRNWGVFLARLDGELERLQAYTPIRGISPRAAPVFHPSGDVYWMATQPLRWRPDLNPETAVTCVVRTDYSPARDASERELITIFGQGFTDRAQDFTNVDQLPLQVDGLSVQWGTIGYDAKPAAILSISATQINVVLPRMFVPRRSVDGAVSRGDHASPAAPGCSLAAPCRTGASQWRWRDDGGGRPRSCRDRRSRRRDE